MAPASDCIPCLGPMESRRQAPACLLHSIHDRPGCRTLVDAYVPAACRCSIGPFLPVAPDLFVCIDTCFMPLAGAAISFCFACCFCGSLGLMDLNTVEIYEWKRGPVPGLGFINCQLFIFETSLKFGLPCMQNMYHITKELIYDFFLSEKNFLPVQFCNLSQRS